MANEQQSDKQVPIVKAIKLAANKKTIPAMDLVAHRPDMAAMMSKMVQSPNHAPQYSQAGNREFENPNVHQLRETSMKTARNISDTEMVLQVLPDLELGAQILTSSVLSPKDNMSSEFNLQAPDGVLKAQAAAEALNLLRTHFEQVYKIKPALLKILRDALIDTGSHIRAVLPENSIDELISRGTAVAVESLSDLCDTSGEVTTIGYLGQGRHHKVEKKSTQVVGGISLESFGTHAPQKVKGNDLNIYLDGQYKKINVGIGMESSVEKMNGAEEFAQGDVVRFGFAVEGLTVTDNFNLLKVPSIHEQNRTQRLDNLLGRRTPLSSKKHQLLVPQISLEGGVPVLKERKLTDRELTSATYRSVSTRHQVVQAMRTQEQLKRYSVGLPLVMELPSEAVIPVHIPGQEDRHVGYFVMVDENGNPLSRKSQRDYYSELQERFSNGSGTNSNFASQMIGRVNHLMNGIDCSKREHIDYSARVWQDMVEQDLLYRLRNGVYTNGVQLASNEELYRIMLARVLSGKNTQLLFLPKEFVTYFAFRYNADGIGKSLMDDMRILNSLRMMLTFAGTMASIRNSIGLTTVDIKLDERDPDPYKTIERVMHETVRVKQQAFPVGVSSPVDITNFLGRAGYDWKVSGHPRLPDVQIEKTDHGRSVVKPDTELEENLRKKSIMSMGLSPEMVDMGGGANFATEVVNNNILLARRVLQIQELFEEQIMDHLRKHLFATNDILKALREIIAEHYEEADVSEEDRLKYFGTTKDTKDASVEFLMNSFIRGLTGQLPKPDIKKVEVQAEAMQSQAAMVDTALNFMVSSEWVTEVTGGNTLATNADAIKNMLKAYLMRRWMAENGVMPELSMIMTEDEDGNAAVNVWKEQETHIQTLLRSLVGFIEKMDPAKRSADKIVEAVTGQEGGGDGAAGSSSSSGDSGGGGSDFGGGDDFGMSFDEPEGGGNDNPENTTEETEETTETTETNLNGEPATPEGGAEGGQAAAPAV